MPEQTAKKMATYQDLCALPGNRVGEIVNGELVATPRPSYRHGNAATQLVSELAGPFQSGKSGGPGGWWILVEPEIHLGEHVLVPDLAGWRKERMPGLPNGNWTDLPPDWVCEILSSSTVKLDRTQKMPIYSEHGVRHVWLLDPEHRTLEVFRLEEAKWLLVSTHAEGERVRAEPFQEVELALGLLWE